MIAPLLALFMLAQLPQPFVFMGQQGATPTPTPTPTGTATPTPGTVVATPVIFPPTGTTPRSVSITCATSGATIFYTLSTGGTNPTHSGATPLGSTLVYSGAFNTGTGTKIVRAIGYKAGMTDSAIASGFYEPGGGE